MAQMENRWLTIIDNIPMNNHRITGLANGVNAQDAVTKNQLDSINGTGNIMAGSSIGQMIYWDGIIWRRTNTNDLVFDPSTEYLGVNVSVPLRRVEIRDTSGYSLRISRNNSVFVDFYCSSSGNLYLYPTGYYIRFTKDLYTDFYRNNQTNTLLGIEVFGNEDLNADYQTAIGYQSLFNAANGPSNVAVGYRALYSKNDGERNTAIGTNAIRHMTYGNNNVAIGYNSGGRDSDFSNANNNVSIGYQAGYSIRANCSNNVSIGYQAGLGIRTNSTGNIFLGYQAGYNEHGSNKLYIDNSTTTTPLIYGEFDSNILVLNGTVGINTSNSLVTQFEIQSPTNPQFRIRQSTVDYCDIGVDTSGNLEITPVGNIEFKKDLFTDRWANSRYNTLIGMGVVGNNNLSGRYNTMVGYHTGYDLTSGQYNIFLGCQSGINVTSGSRNILVGRYSAERLLSCNDNIIMGYQAGRGSSNYNSSHNNIIIGYQSGYRINSNSSSNILLGQRAGYNCQNSNNIYIGRRAGYNNNAGSNNISIGYYSGYRSEGDRNIFIGYRAGYNENVNSNRLYIDNSDTRNPLIYGEFDNNLLKINGDLEIEEDLKHIGDHIGFFNTTPVTQHTTISNPSGGSTIDTEARATINALISLLQNYGLMN